MALPPPSGQRRIPERELGNADIEVKVSTERECLWKALGVQRLCGLAEEMEVKAREVELTRFRGHSNALG